MKYFSLIFLGVGILLLAFAVFFLVREKNFLTHAQVTNGTVADYSYSSRGSVYPIVEFTTKSDQQVRYRSNLCSNPPAYQQGQRVQVYYDPGNLKDAQLAGVWGQYAMTLIMVMIGLPFSLVGVWLYFFLRR